MEAEYIALSIAAKHFLWLKTALNDLRFPEIPIALLYNNHSAIDLTENYRISEHSTYIKIHHHNVRELVYNKNLRLMYIRTADDLTDIYTNGLPEIQLSKLCTIALGYNEGRCCNANRF
jgi:hypothetical protein